MKTEILTEAVLIKKGREVHRTNVIQKYNDELLMPSEVLTWWKTLKSGDSIRIEVTAITDEIRRAKMLRFVSAAVQDPLSKRKGRRI